MFFLVIGFPLLIAVGIWAFVMPILAAIKVSNGELDYRYPLTLRLLK